jgi:hypothetical protein
LEAKTMNALSLITMNEQTASFAGQFTSADAAKTYMLAGHATVTLESKKTGRRFTYKISKKANDGVAFVSLLRGPENTADYAYLGTIFLASQDGFRITAKSTISPEAPSAMAFAWAWERIAGGHLPETLNVWHEGTCGRCGRALTVPESIASGIGPVCKEKG